MTDPNQKSLGEAIALLLKTYQLEDKFEQARLIQSWESVVGSMIARHTTDLYIQKKTLFVYIDSDALRHELSFARGQIIQNLNQAAGKEVIDEIVFR
ncbi:MAG: DUF721 domain-containing protein [Bacteroidales bacterium]|nr:DUF721 domain-containing protein [Bacteroidales bacterium]